MVDLGRGMRSGCRQPTLSCLCMARRPTLVVQPRCERAAILPIDVRNRCSNQLYLQFFVSTLVHAVVLLYTGDMEYFETAGGSYVRFLTRNKIYSMRDR